MLIVLTTTSNTEDAETLAEKIVESRLAACVQVVPGMTSVYFWDDKVQKAQECLLLIKTMPDKYDKLESLIKANHSYETPEIVAIDASRTSAEYLSWVSGYLS